jgi:hypothetical protein
MIAGMPVQSIEAVIASLTEIVDDCQRRNSRLGYFPAMYRKVTLRVDEGIRRGRFEDNERMERLDVVFANRYIEAYRRFQDGQAPTHSWAFTFEMAAQPYPMIFQHLILGMNAHINLDLGIAAAEVSRGQDLQCLENDFFEINALLADLLDEVQSGINESSPLFHVVDRLGWWADEALGNFSIRHARRSAWNKARELHELPNGQWQERIDAYDREVADFARILCPPLKITAALFQAVSERETQEPRQIIMALRH